MPPNPNQPNTLGISQGIVALLETATFPTSISGFSAYNVVKQGMIKDVTDVVPWAAVTALAGTSKHFAAGGRVDEKPQFRIMTGVSYQDSTQAEIDILTVRDAIIPLFEEHSTLQGVQNVYTLVVRENSERYAFLQFLGVVYRVHFFEIIVSQQYQLPQGVID
jgi:hypothetical protein